MINTKSFALAGNATFTVTSRKTGIRFTFKVEVADDGKCHFVKLLTGPDNWTNYKCFGTIRSNGEFKHSQNPKCSISPDAPSAKAFAWLWRNIDDKPVEINGVVVEHPMALVEVHHEGKCCRCGRKLTVPRSIELGCGPECAETLGVNF